MSKRHPHCGKYTRGSKPQRLQTTLAIERGFNKMNLFFTGKPILTNPSPSLFKNNPFADMLQTLIGKNHAK